MSKTTIALIAGLLAGSTIFSANGAGAAQEQAKAKTSAVATGTSDGSAATDENAAAGRNTIDDQSTNEARHESDEAEIRKNTAAFIKAYTDGDAKALATLFTKDAECVHESSLCCRGRDAIEKSLAEFFEQNPGCRLQKTIDSIRFVSPNVAIENGTTMCECEDESSCVVCAYTTVHVRTEGKWLVASIQDRDSHDLKQHSLKLGQLDWLQGDWVDEGDDAVVHFSCEPTDSGNFLVRSFTIEVAGQKTMTGTQRIGWDPFTGKLRAWIFDSSGSFGEGVWYRATDETLSFDDTDKTSENEQQEDNSIGTERWMLRTSGVLADGKTASGTSIYTRMNDHTMTWQSVDLEIAGVQQPDSEVITIVRKAAPLDATPAVEAQ